MNSEISVIVPVYNAELYLDICIKSILNQSYQNWELILIDDGSTDRSLAICKQYEAASKQIKCYHKSNGGVGSARNLGMSHAKGTYLVFVDSDDVLNQHMLKELYQGAQNGSFDLVICGYSETADTTTVIQTKTATEGEYSFEDYITILNQYKTDPFCGGPYAKLYQTNMIRTNHIEFLTDTSYAEDFGFNMEVLKYCNHIKIIAKSLYYYRVSTQNSLSKKNKPLKMLRNRNTEIFQLYQSIYAAHGLAEKYCGVINEFYFFLHLAIYTEIFRNAGLTHKVQAVAWVTKRISDDKLIIVKQNSLNKKYKIMADIILRCKKHKNYRILTLILSTYCRVKGL